VKLAFIVDDASRKRTYNKRRKSLLKKVYELSTLCGVEACAIVYGPYEPQPEIWPSPQGVQTILSKFRAMTDGEKSKKMENQETYMQQRVLKAIDKLKMQRHDNNEKEMVMLMFQCLGEGKLVQNNISLLDSKYLCWLIDQKLKDVGRMLEVEDNNGQHQIQLQMAPPLISEDEEMAMMGHGHVGMNMNNGEIMESQFSMGLMTNGNGDDTVPFGEVDPRFLPNLHLE